MREGGLVLLPSPRVVSLWKITAVTKAMACMGSQTFSQVCFPIDLKKHAHEDLRGLDSKAVIEINEAVKADKDQLHFCARTLVSE